MQIFDSATGRAVTFMPPTARAKPQPIGMYVCGVTPYDAAHAGHIFTFLTYDLLQRRLEDQGYRVRLVRNITDVDDPLFARAAELGEDYRQLAERETKRLQSVLHQLNFRPAFAEPRASEYIGPMAAAVGVLLDKGYAYQLGKDIYYDVGRYPAFATHTIPKHLRIAFMAERGGDPGRPGKHQPLDFLLWRGVTDPQDIAVWQTGLGRGRPGWHIECSVMSDQLLGTPFAIHGGGSDLIFPHHACERAQTAALRDGDESSLAGCWLHVAPLALYGEKMSKSLGNLIFAHELLEHWSPNAIRLALMRYHYRTGGEWRNEYLDEAESLAQALRAMRTDEQLPDLALHIKQIRRSLDTDLDMPAVIHALQDMLNDPVTRTATPEDRSSLRAIDNLLGLV